LQLFKQCVLYNRYHWTIFGIHAFSTFGIVQVANGKTDYEFSLKTSVSEKIW